MKTIVALIITIIIASLIALNLYQDHTMKQKIEQEYQDFMLKKRTRDAVRALEMRPFEEIAK